MACMRSAIWSSARLQREVDMRLESQVEFLGTSSKRRIPNGVFSFFFFFFFLEGTLRPDTMRPNDIVQWLCDCEWCWRIGTGESPASLSILFDRPALRNSGTRSDKVMTNAHTYFSHSLTLSFSLSLTLSLSLTHSLIALYLSLSLSLVPSACPSTLYPHTYKYIRIQIYFL